MAHRTVQMSTQMPTPPLTRDTSQERRSTAVTFSQAVRESTITLSKRRNGSVVILNGEDLQIADLVAVARHTTQADISDSPLLHQNVDASVKALAAKLRAGEVIYGVNTGYGGSADTRTSNLDSLQRALVQHQNTGILSRADIDVTRSTASAANNDGGATSMPRSWVRGLMLSRINSLLRGHSAVSMPVIEAILALLKNDLTPIVPLRGSISASGDLQPLSYIAATLQGNPFIYVRTSGKAGNRVVSAPEALEIAGLKPIVLAAKEGLGLLNGTAASVAAASLVLHDTRNLALLSQALTVMAVEALAGTAASFDPFISAARPHGGQEQAAATMRSFLAGTKLAHGMIASDVDHMRSGLCQDRYALRTSPQWIGPLLEDLELAISQLKTELNSTTDNPLIDSSGAGTIHHGGNFQASSTTSALEKTRNALQQLGKMLFAQSTELNNPAMNRGLPPNLCADDPSTSFTCKGIDINMAAYASELGWLNHPVGPHVQSAEMHNQAINSLALLSARATQQAVEVLSCMCAAYLFMACQALDLRVLLVRLFAAVEPEFKRVVSTLLQSAGLVDEDIRKSIDSLWAQFEEDWNNTTTLDLAQRCEETAKAATGHLLHVLTNTPVTDSSTNPTTLAAFKDYHQTLSSLLHATYISLRTEMFSDCLSITPKYLGRAASMLYTLVRKDLGVPFFRGLIEDPTETSPAGFAIGREVMDRERKTLGCWISTIYDSLRDDSLFARLADVV